MNKLIFVPTPLTEESPHSLIKRTAQCHGFSTTGKLNGLCIGPQTFRSTSLTQNSDFAKLFVAEAGINGQHVLNGFYATIEKPKQRRRFVIGGIEIPITYIRLRTGAYCDGCFNEGWERQIRDLKFAEFCPYHLKKYLTHCPECQMPVEWWHALDGKCRHCGKVLKCQPCTLEECRLERMLVELMRTRSQLDFDRLLSLTRQLGYVPEKPTVPDATRRMIFIGAISIMTDDTRVILEHLFKLYSLNPDVEKFWIAARFSLVATPAAREASRIFLESRCQPFPNLAFSHPPFVLTFRQLRTALNISAVLMSKIKKHTPFAQRSLYSCFTAEEAAILENNANKFLLADNGRLPIPKKDMLSRATACQELGISHATLKIYVQHNLLKPSLASNNAPFFFPSDIKQFPILYEQFHNLSRKVGMPTRRLRMIVDSLNIEILPDRNINYRHWLIRKSDADSVIAAIASESKRPRQWLILPRADFSKTSETDYYTIREAARELQTATSNVFAAIRKNILKNACRGKKKKLLIPKTDIQKFKCQFTTIKQAAKIIKVHFPRASDLLFGFGVLPVMGPIVNGTRDNIYKTTDIMRVAKLAEREDPNEHSYYLSKTFTENRLNITPGILSTLMAAGVINYIKGREGTYFMPSWLKKFEERFVFLPQYLTLAGLSQKMAPQMIHLLESIGITPVHLKTNDQSLQLYERIDLQNLDDVFFIKMAHLAPPNKYCKNIKHTTKPPPEGYTAIKELIKTYEISTTDFTNLFLKFEFISTIKKNQTTYISSSDRNKCEFILKNYCTRAMASKIIPGGYYKVTALLRSGILEREYPIPVDLTQITLISKSKLKKYIDSQPTSIAKS